MTLEPLLWERCNQSLIAKIIGECAYEECWVPTPVDPSEPIDPDEQTNLRDYELVIGQRSYCFRAHKTIWGWLQVDPESIRCQGTEVSSATEFLVNAQQDLKLSDIDLGNLLEEIQNTLYSTYRQQERLSAYTAGDMVQLPAEELQSLLDGHPKAIANKGRMGWGTEELARYAPESGQSVRLQLLLVHRSLCIVGYEPETDPWHLLQQHISDGQKQAIDQRLKDRGATQSDYYPVPVHPWQWQRHINIQYQTWIQSGAIILAGELADDYLPQQSIRTFSNLRDRADYDIKLPLTILNTSCFRGIPGKHIETGADLSQWLSSIVSEDPLLSGRGLVVQREICGIHCRHPIQEQVAQTPYRYREMLGVVWRESLQKFVDQGEQGILMATLMQCDSRGKALVAEYIRRSELAPEEWLRELFSTVVVPLYHLMAKYGVGLVAHGQNISVILKDHVPVRVSVKDFHGDLRIVDQDFPELADMPMQVKACLTRLPAKYLIHDLVTGHFVTTLRFISPLVEEQCGVTEARFYALLAESISKYQKQHPELTARYELFPMFTDTILKVCINRVRFRIGYADSAERPIPELGTPINNPLVLDRVTEHDYDTAS